MCCQKYNLDRTNLWIISGLHDVYINGKTRQHRHILCTSAGVNKTWPKKRKEKLTFIGAYQGQRDIWSSNIFQTGIGIIKVHDHLTRLIKYLQI